MLKAVIWDVDGTLISTKRLYPEAYRRALAPIIGRELSDEEMFRVASHSELRFLRAHARDRYEECLREFRRHYAELHATHFDGIYDGVREVLEELRGRGLAQGVVTGKSRSSYLSSTAFADLGQFDVLIMDDDVSEPKPHPEGILAAVAALHVEPENALYVGDSVTDVMAAHAAQTNAAIALWSKPVPTHEHILDLVGKVGPALVLEAPTDLLTHLPH